LKKTGKKMGRRSPTTRSRPAARKRGGGRLSEHCWEGWGGCEKVWCGKKTSRVPAVRKEGQAKAEKDPKGGVPRSRKVQDTDPEAYCPPPGHLRGREGRACMGTEKLKNSTIFSGGPTTEGGKGKKCRKSMWGGGKKKLC